MVLFVAFPFLAFGCASFLLCAAIPPLRRFALSSSLWCVACVPCLLTILAAIIVCSAGAEAFHRFFKLDFDASVSFHQTSWLGWGIAIISFVLTVAGATFITIVHGIITRRFTLALFRLYVAGVSFGVGILTCSFVLFAFATHLLSFIAFGLVAFASLLAASALAYACFTKAPDFRGSYPQRFPVVTPEEFGRI
jgi:hypothetical protein